MNREHKILFAFQIKNKNEFIYELKYLDVPENSSPSDRFQWFFKNKLSNNALLFKNMTKTTRDLYDDKESIFYFLDIENLSIKVKVDDNSENTFEIFKIDDFEKIYE
jgi:hypothetical protein